MAKQKKTAAKPRKAPAKKTAAKPRKAAVHEEKVTTRKAASVRAKRAPAPTAALPPDFPIIPFADTLVGREFYARVNCKLAPNRKGKLVNRCDTQRVTVVGGAAPSAAKPKVKQVFAVQKGQRYIVPDRELRRAVRVPAAPPESTPCEVYADRLSRGSTVPVMAWDECPNLPDVGAANDVSFEPFEFDAPKLNHHGGHHEMGDPLGTYLPPLERWAHAVPYRQAETYSWRHPTLLWTFAIYVHGRKHNTLLFAPQVHKRGETIALQNRKTLASAYEALRRWYAAQPQPQPQPKHNGAAQAVPGGSYVSGRPDAWLGQSVGGDDFAGPIRARAHTLDGAPAHVVGGHVMTRARALAGVRREDIRTGVLPAPAGRGRTPKVVATVRGEELPHALRPLPPRPPRSLTMPPPPRAPRLGVPALEEARPRPSRFGVPALEEARERPMGASAVEFEWSESELLNKLGLPRTFTGPAMWQEATAFLRQAIAEKLRERNRNPAGSKGYTKTKVKVSYPDGFYYEGRYDVGDPIPTDFAEFVMLASKYAKQGHYLVPARSGPAMPTPFTSGGGVLPAAQPSRPASRELGHWAVVKPGDQVVLHSGHRMEATMRGTVAEVVHGMDGDPGVVLLDPQKLREGDGVWVNRYEDQRPGDTLRVMRGKHRLEIAPHQPGNVYRAVPPRHP